MNHGVRQHFYCIECATYLKRSQVCGWNFELRRIDPGIFLLSQRNPLTRKHRSLVSHEAACRLPIAFNMFTSEGNTIWWPKFLLEGSRWCGVPASASPASSMQRLPFQERLVLPVEARPAIHPFASDGRPPAICGAAVACIRCSRFMRLFPDVARPATWHTLPTGKTGPGIDHCARRRRRAADGLVLSFDAAHLSRGPRSGEPRRARPRIYQCAQGFNRPSEVLNGFSDLMIEVFGDAGRHTRSAIGVAELYADIPIEVEALFELAT
jgi:hypothetical protein